MCVYIYIYICIYHTSYINPVRAKPVSVQDISTVSSQHFNSHNFKLRVSNPRTIAYTQFPSQDSGLFGPNPWKVLAPMSNYLSNNGFWATQPLEKVLRGKMLWWELGVFSLPPEASAASGWTTTTASRRPAENIQPLSQLLYVITTAISMYSNTRV